MGPKEIEQKLAFADSKLSLITKYLARDFSVVKGTLEKCGRLETTTTVESSTTGGTAGRYGDGSFGALSHSKTSESVSVSRTISLVKIGSTTLTDVWIPTAGFFDAIELGENIGVVIYNKKAEMWLIKNYSDGSTVGSQPSMTDSMLFKWLGLLIAVGGVFSMISTLLSAELPSSSLFAILIGFIVYRSYDIAMREEQSSWNRALDELAAS
jgi:hypothetical protein